METINDLIALRERQKFFKIWKSKEAKELESLMETNRKRHIHWIMVTPNIKQT